FVPRRGVSEDWVGSRAVHGEDSEFHGSLNLLKGGLVFADFLNTVSPTYSREIQSPEFGFGLDGVVRERRDRLVGIVNGIDTEVWDPATDQHVASRYSVS